MKIALADYLYLLIFFPGFPILLAIIMAPLCIVKRKFDAKEFKLYWVPLCYNFFGIALCVFFLFLLIDFSN